MWSLAAQAQLLNITNGSLWELLVGASNHWKEFPDHLGGFRIDIPHHCWGKHWYMSSTFLVEGETRLACDCKSSQRPQEPRNPKQSFVITAAALPYILMRPKLVMGPQHWIAAPPSIAVTSTASSVTILSVFKSATSSYSSYYSQIHPQHGNIHSHTGLCVLPLDCLQLLRHTQSTHVDTGTRQGARSHRLQDASFLKTEIGGTFVALI